MKRAILALILAIGLVTGAQAYPDRSVTMIVPYNAGGSLDSMTRIVVEYMKKDLGKSITISNRPGASGTIGAKAFLNTKPDGYTILVLPTSTFVTPVFQGRDPLDFGLFKSIGAYIKSERILFAKAGAPYETFAQFKDYAQKNPGKLKFGSGGSTDTAYVFKYILKQENLDVNVTLFNGGAPAAAAILGGHVDLIEGGVGSPGDVAAKAGKLIPLTILSSGSVGKYPQLKTSLEMGYKYASDMMFGFFLHANAPDEARDILAASMERVLKNKELLKKFASRGVEPTFYNAQQLDESANKALKVGELYELLGK